MKESPPALRGLYWRLYAALLGIFLTVVYLSVFWAEFRPIYLVDLPLTALAYSGLVGFVRSKRYISQPFWRVYVFAFVVWELVFNLRLSPSAAEVDVITFFAIFIPVLGPLYVALWLYGFRSPAVWRAVGV